MTDDDPQVSGRAGVEPAAQVVGRVGREIGLLLAGGRDPAAQPLLDQLGVVRAEPPRAGPDLGRDAAPGERRRGGGARVRPEQPPARRRSGAGGRRRRRRTRRRAGSDGMNPTEPVTDRVSSAGQPAAVQAAARASTSSAVSRSSSADAVTSDVPASCAASRPVRSPGSVRGGDRRAVGRRPGQAGLRASQQRGVAVVQDPVLRAGQLRREPAAQRAGAAAEVADRPAGARRRSRPRGERGAARASRGGVGGLAQREPVRGADR